MTLQQEINFLRRQELMLRMLSCLIDRADYESDPENVRAYKAELRTEAAVETAQLREKISDLCRQRDGIPAIR